MTLSSRHWCEHCNDWDDVDHYTEMTPEGGGEHKAGIEYGIFGRCLAAMDLIAETLKTDGWLTQDWLERAHALAEGRKPDG